MIEPRVIVSLDNANQPAFEHRGQLVHCYLTFGQSNLLLTWVCDSTHQQVIMAELNAGWQQQQTIDDTIHRLMMLGYPPSYWYSSVGAITYLNRIGIPNTALTDQRVV